MQTYANIVHTLPTVAVFVSGVVMAADEIPTLNFEQSIPAHIISEPVNFGDAQTQYNITNVNIDTFQNIETLHKFASNLLENIEDLDPEFSKAIDENYWDLI